MKHANATHAQVALTRSAQDKLPHIEVADDGAGFDPGTASAGIGIIGMRERVYALGGSISFSSDRDSGTVVAIVLPLKAPTAVS